MTEHVAHDLAHEVAEAAVRPYGLVAEFVDEPRFWRPRAVRRRVPPIGRLHPHSGGRPIGGSRLPQEPHPAAHAAGRHRRAGRRFALQYWVHVINYPINIGGKPLNSVPMWVPVTFETTVLLAALTGVLAMIVLNGLPAPYHPLFNVAEFARASQDRFFLAIEATDPRFDMTQTRRFLENLAPASVHEVLP